MYMPDIGRWGVVDPMSELTYLSPFNYVENNPINLTDPTGMFSTHTDEDGQVLAVVDDGDLGVYRHEDAQTKEEVMKKREETGSTDGGGEKMGETEFWDEFVVPGTSEARGFIYFGEDQAWEPLIEWGNERATNQDLTITMEESKHNQVLDIKTDKDWAQHGPMTGRLLNGKYATARSAGNYLAGMNGVTGTIQGQRISGETYMKLAGAYQQGKLSVTNIAKILMTGASFGPAPYYGEQNYSGRRIQQGIDAGYKKLKQ